jgi:predicted nucleic acid-binding protein
MIVVADTSPLNYLILIGSIDVLPVLYGEVIIPPAVQDEMLSYLAPPSVRSWIGDPPRWLEVRTPVRSDIPLDPELDEGEREAILLAHASGENASLLIDERVGRREAARLGLQVTGTLGILLTAHKRGLLDMRVAIERLRATTFKASDALLHEFLGRA